MGRPSSQGGQDPLQHGLLAFVGFLLGGGAVATRCLQLLQALLDHAEVGQRELQLQLLHVAGRIDAQERVGDGIAGEGTDDMQQRVGIAEPSQLIGRDVRVGLTRRAAVAAAGRST